MTSTSTPDHILALLSTIPTPDIQQSPPSTSIHPTRSVSPVQLSHSDSTLDTLPPTSSELKEATTPPPSKDDENTSEVEITAVKEKIQDDQNAQYEHKILALQLQNNAARMHLAKINALWTKVWKDHPIASLDPIPLLSHSPSATTDSFISIIDTKTEQMSNAWALKTFDNSFHIHWNVLHDLIDTTSRETQDEVLDAWFSILFASATPPHATPNVACLSTLVTELLYWKKENFAGMVQAGFNTLHKYSYWRNLEYLFIPIIYHRTRINHWIFVRVLIKEKVVEIYDSLGEVMGVGHQQKLSKFLNTLYIHSEKQYSVLHKEQIEEAGDAKKIQWTFRQPQDDHPKQEGTYDCGIFVMHSMRLLLQGDPLSYGQADIPGIRRNILAILHANIHMGMVV